MNTLQRLRSDVRHAPLTRRIGRVREVRGLSIDCDGPPSVLGELCAILPGRGSGRGAAAHFDEALLHATPDVQADAGLVLAEVVAVQGGRTTLMPYGPLEGLSAGDPVAALERASHVDVGPELLGRVIDAFGRPLDGLPAPRPQHRAALRSLPQNPMRRPRVRDILETGIRSIDGLLTMGKGQRVGIFAGSGVGKSTLLGMMARHVHADVNVLALIGERGREVREFIEKQLDAQALRRCVVVVATADQPAPARLRAAHAALAIAEHFRAEGRHVLLTMDSITRFAMARREVGLAAGEPPTARGYTPSVFAELPQLCERCGTAASGGSITALLTVLVEGDDLNEPVSDALRAILDGHIVLSREIAHQGQYPAIDILKSTSRLLPDLASASERELAVRTVRLLALLQRNEQMVELGAYEAGSNPELDAALRVRERLVEWLRQSAGGIARSEALASLHDILAAAAPAVRKEAPVAPARSRS